METTSENGQTELQSPFEFRDTVDGKPDSSRSIGYMEAFRTIEEGTAPRAVSQVTFQTLPHSEASPNVTLSIHNF